MKRLPGIVLALCATLIVLVALAVSGLRLALPYLDDFRPRIVQTLNAATGLNIHIREMHGSWQSFGPTLDIGGFASSTADEQLRIQRVTVALNVWQSLLHWRWQFRDVTFYRLQLDLNTTLLGSDHQGSPIKSDQLTDLFLYQFDHFILRDSDVSFLSPSGDRITLSMPQLTWLNTNQRHRAEGRISLSNVDVAQGAIQLRMDLNDKNGLLNNGKVYLQADNINVKPWLSQWAQDQSGLKKADFSLAAWLTIDNGDIVSGDAFFSQGEARWLEGDREHRLDVANMALHLSQLADGWQLDAPALNMSTDGASWAPGSLSLFWLPEKNHLFTPNRHGEVHLRAKNLQLERFSPFLSLFSAVTPNLQARWQDLQPHGTLSTLALDIPLNQPQQTRFQGTWRDIGWQQWQLLPGADHVTGSAAGSLATGRLTLALDNSTLPYKDMFRAPLEVQRARVTLDWTHGDNGLELRGKNIDLRANSLWATGDFNFHQPVNGEPRLDILSGIRLYDAAQAWRYFPEPLMGTHLVDYLTGALKGGYVDNATLVFAGDPKQFPFKHNDGQFQVLVPLRHADYAFEPEWPHLTDLAIDLDFLNDGLFMHAPQAQLGDASGSNIVAVIPDYAKELLLVDANVSGSGKAIGDYFTDTPLKTSLGEALGELQIDGNVSGDLHLTIPLDGRAVSASGNVNLAKNSLLIKPLDVTLKALSGQFRYHNGNLESDTLTGQLLGQPVSVDFTTLEQPKGFDIKVGIQGDSTMNRLPGLPSAMAKALTGNAAWQSDIAVSLPYNGKTTYEVNVTADLKNVSSHLPEPLDKPGGKSFPVTLNAHGNLTDLTLSGRTGKNNAFNSEWALGKQISLLRGAWTGDSNKVPPLPSGNSMTVDLPALDGEQWLGLMTPESRSTGKVVASRFRFPDTLTLKTPRLTLGGQQWRDLSVTRLNALGGSSIEARGREIDGKLFIANQGPWRADIRYLYYNPLWQQTTDSENENVQAALFNDDVPSTGFSHWPALQFRCQSCWILGQNLGRVEADITPNKTALLLTNGVVDNGKSRLTLDGSWSHTGQQNRTSVKGKLSGKNIGEATDYIGIATPLRESPFNADYDLHWQAAPWAPDIASLNGVLHSTLGKGKIDDISSGQAGRLLRLVSFDALLRKLQFDFRDTFGKGFYFDSIKGTAWIKDGVLHTNDLLVDGLEADIAMNGQVDFNAQQIDMQAVIAPEISATVGVATAFAINPVVGAAVFAASKVLAPLWNKISVIRYHITGSLDQPKIEEVLRQPRQPKDKGN
ncbi:AsmA2 domain-containing protein YhdP [Acerihabitans sp. TG2]|uniref:AsmA2 domain-containing protein YhdP n=1 Tax=Acerihabitans sp. TG2 TaxID=3096008 RepID=UPI002B222C3B|nr:AsmA2 domain-containing protein YhdP [Acerihabitans sp. TG2]MEA9390317.1 AsmA2 domain-containing protein YhdP [Acerihabitans sp. TG2]